MFNPKMSWKWTILLQNKPLFNGLKIGKIGPKIDQKSTKNGLIQIDQKLTKWTWNTTEWRKNDLQLSKSKNVSEIKPEICHAKAYFGPAQIAKFLNQVR